MIIKFLLNLAHSLRKERINMENIINALKGYVRVNKTLKTVEIYNEYGVQLVLHNLAEETLRAFEKEYEVY